MSYPPPGNQPDPYQPDPYQPGQPYDPQQSGPPAYPTQPPTSGQPDPYAPYGQPPPQPPYGQGYPGYPQQPAPYGYEQPGYAFPQAQPRGMNTMAILALILGILVPPVGIVLGHIAKNQLKTSGEEGGGLATAGLVVGYVLTGLYLLFCCGAIGLGWLGSTLDSTGSTGTSY
ncbi:DUF4190 domain-containing protein [Asanoa siamensis]|uniref:DUF4190 domain-containing protein n=1 Tax=Asanoa siamensis TaxID=926357 RepID=A0ABQ4CH73_9ACTN|nr:DUF4190 domain-containing protein [Asanoa siamensis]GIF70647.1 hypothetical protein Asi02nite_01650 [Asanoa siamensis]